MEIKTIKVSEKGQIAIPREIREQAHIEKGDKLIIIQSNGKILIEKAETLTEEIEDDFSDLLKLSEITLKDFWSSKEDDIWDTI